jgi:hypothetical protein
MGPCSASRRLKSKVWLTVGLRPRISICRTLREGRGFSREASDLVW